MLAEKMFHSSPVNVKKPTVFLFFLSIRAVLELEERKESPTSAREKIILLKNTIFSEGI